MIQFAFFIFDDVIKAVSCLLQNIGYAVLWALCSVINLVVAALGILISALIYLLPSIPENIAVIPSNITGPLNWFVPIHAIRIFFLALIVCYGVWLAYKVVMNWMKVE